MLPQRAAHSEALDHISESASAAVPAWDRIPLQATSAPLGRPEDKPRNPRRPCSFEPFEQHHIAVRLTDGSKNETPVGRP